MLTNSAAKQRIKFIGTTPYGYQNITKNAIQQ